MSQKEIIAQTLEYVKRELSGEGSGHDWWHVYRVYNTSVNLGKVEDADLFVVELAALLHDIADHKFHNGDASVGPRVAGEWLTKLKVHEDVIAQVREIIRDLSFKGAEVETPMRTLEGKIVQDADRLDAIGAIGIARTFAYGGHKGFEMHNPDKKPVLHDSFGEYKSAEGTTINHFYEKLLLLKDRMNTETAKKLAEERHHLMENYLKAFYKEWEGN